MDRSPRPGRRREADDAEREHGDPFRSRVPRPVTRDRPPDRQARPGDECDYRYAGKPPRAIEARQRNEPPRPPEQNDRCGYHGRGAERRRRVGPGSASREERPADQHRNRCENGRRDPGPHRARGRFHGGPRYHQGGSVPRASTLTNRLPSAHHSPTGSRETCDTSERDTPQRPPCAAPWCFVLPPHLIPCASASPSSPCSCLPPSAAALRRQGLRRQQQLLRSSAPSR